MTTLTDKLSRISSEPPVIAPSEVLLEVERSLHPLPNAYRQFLQMCGGASVFPDVAIFDAKGYGEVDVEAFLSAHEVVENTRRYKQRLGEGVITIATSSGGDLLCLSSDGSVVFWDHETDSRTRVGRSFSEFFFSLREQSSTPAVSLDDVVVELDPDLLK